MQQGGETERERETHSHLQGLGHSRRTVEGCVGCRPQEGETHNHPEVGAGGREADGEEKR